ncbi:outer membrane protein assembly factor BamD [Acidithiobacillus caldus]|jgi:outer membrane protein assembly factor BamD|uniref:Outer membrane protein assembly factor BamD n=3 Tax=Acidithiobacillus caldus TaxID=33059 RepID=F9ZSA3_ACICS|nr:outer membrane protein assembly factor BamD [Acidithiobacillus caldus]AEK59082.1 Probable component of the lipoprotein assembly complex (forms a complex with YaeT, YfgL, and NlpB) [Acidithiobacillus caldus SM-1]AUW33475.1 outer membrane protein assembly factor BamD [Acidithiobacillus caldus]MBU2730146.1 outer membrane protein assembly factor BamD [Acidithiobacillus caldus]MBU2745525.1 outer membrane protein assembly factor BamD [Acidithiobacillus caldus]MBU2763477.1 outer membrane protein a
MRKRIVFPIVAHLTLLGVLSGCASDGAKDSLKESSHLSAAAMYRPAKAAQDRGDYSSAVRLYEELETRYPYGPYAEQAQLNTAYCYYKQGDSEAAAAAAERFIKLHPVNPFVDYAWYLKGIAYYQAIQGAQWNPKPLEESFATLETLVKRWPNSAYAADARLRMEKIIDILGQRELDICKFYYIRHAYVAAANRCNDVVTRYQLSPAREEALYYLSLSYRHMNLDGLAKTTAGVLKANYPQSKYLKELP